MNYKYFLFLLLLIFNSCSTNTNNIKLNENAIPIAEERNYEIKKIDLSNPQIENNKILLIFENNLSFGIDWDIGFGSLLKRDTLIVNNIVVTDFNEFSYSNIYLDTYESRLLFRSNSFKINSLYDLDKLQISSSIAFDYELLIIENMNYFTNNNLYTGTEFLSTSSDSKKPNFNIRAFGVGFAYKLAKNSALNLEIHSNSGR